MILCCLADIFHRNTCPKIGLGILTERMIFPFQTQMRLVLTYSRVLDWSFLFGWLLILSIFLSVKVGFKKKLGIKEKEKKNAYFRIQTIETCIHICKDRCGLSGLVLFFLTCIILLGLSCLHGWKGRASCILSAWRRLFWVCNIYPLHL